MTNPSDPSSAPNESDEAAADQRPTDPEERRSVSAPSALRPAPQAPDDNALLVEAASGDQAAFGQLYDSLAATVYGVAVRVIRNPAIAEEVAQDVFVEVWRLAPRFDPIKGSARGWITSIAHRRAVDRVRSEQSSRNRERADGRGATDAHDSVVDEVVTRNEHERVGAALAELSAPQREAVTLAFYGGHSYGTVARILGQPEGTIKGRIRDGLSRIRHVLEGQR